MKTFQKKAGLKQDGKYGDQTHTALMAAIADNDVGQRTEPDPEPEQLSMTRVKIVCNSGTVATGNVSSTVRSNCNCGRGCSGSCSGSCNCANSNS